MGHGEGVEHATLVRDLEEDLATRWVPDVVADADIREAVLRPRVSADDVRMVDVPRVSGGTRSVPVLSGSALSALRTAVEPLRRVGDRVLDPAVCGYRTGSTGGVSYSDEYRRFRAFTEALGDESSWVVVADVKNFFDSVSPETVRCSLADDFGATEALDELLREFHVLGVAGLPAGYGDARLVANAVLGPVDRALGVPFTRWVDDYRIFAASRSEAERAVAKMRDCLSSLGLALNESKLEVVSTREYRNVRHGAPLDSVYHPQDEPRGAVRAALRSVFLAAAAAGDRRRLRFALPRLAQEGDGIAVDYALQALQGNSIDAPRLVHYLSAFVSKADVAARLRSLSLDPAVSEWVLMRAMPLLYRIDLDGDFLDEFSRRVELTNSSLHWGLMLRLLAINEHSSVPKLLSQRETFPDPRAVASVVADSGVRSPEIFNDPAVESVLLAWRGGVRGDLGALPLPKVESLL